MTDFTDDEKMEHLRRAFCHAGGLVVECQQCKRVHFASEEGDYDKGELEELLEQQKKEPDKYLDCIDEYTRWGWFGVRFVFGCPCGFDQRLARILWESRQEVLDFVASMSKIAADRTSHDEKAVRAARAALGPSHREFPSDEGRFEEL
jgi:hypothetical protein